MKYSAEPNGRASANGAGSPLAAVACALTKVRRTNPQVALGSSFSSVQISFAVSSSVISASKRKRQVDARLGRCNRKVDSI